MSSIEDAILALNAAKDRLEDAWNSGSTAKDEAAEGVDKILDTIGPQSNAPEDLRIALEMIAEGRNQFEQGQALMTTAQAKIDEYIAILQA